MSSGISDPWLRAALGVGVVAMLLTLALVLAIVFLRLRLRWRERRWDRFVETWRPALLAAMLGGARPAVLPVLRANEHVLFLRLWTYLQESVRGDAARVLNETAMHLRLDATARTLLRRGSRTEKLQATLAAGYLRDIAAWDMLVALARGRDSLLSVHAARALVRINPLRAANGLMPLLLARTDWDLARVAGFLGEARHAFWLLMAKVIPRVKPADLPRALLLAEALRLQLPDATVARLLAPGQSPAVLQAALRLAEAPPLGAAVRACLDHADAGVREQAALQLARLAGPDDIPVLGRLLDDPEWPVRMAAARSLARLPYLSTEELEGLGELHPGAAPVLRHVLAERRMG